MRKVLAGIGMALLATAATAQSGDPAAQRKALLERARAAELPGTWQPAPTSKLSNAAVNYAQRLCSAVFIEGMDAKLAKARSIKQGMMQELLTGKIRLPVAGVRVASLAESDQPGPARSPSSPSTFTKQKPISRNRSARLSSGGRTR